MVGAKGLAVAVAGAFRPDTPEDSGSSRPAQANRSVRPVSAWADRAGGCRDLWQWSGCVSGPTGPNRGDETWFRLSLQVQAIDPRRNRDEQS